LRATTEINGKIYGLKITYIYPTIVDGRFETDLEFIEKIPEGIKSGQTLRLRIELGNSNTAMLLKTGAFFNQSGGNWIYVLEENDTKASKREIKLGKQNSEYYEVISGLDIGERVITSSYRNFGNNEIIKFN